MSEDKYVIFTPEGESQVIDSAPDSGFYYIQDGTGGGFTLYEVDPNGGNPIELDSWDTSPSTLEYVVTTDGQAYDRIENNHGILNLDHVAFDTEKPVEEYTQQPTEPDTPEMPPVADRESNVLEPGEKLASEESETGRNTLGNGGYELERTSDDRIVLRDPSGNEIWGYYGDDLDELLHPSSGYRVQLNDDGSVVLVDENGIEVRTLRAADDTKHVRLVTLYHPPHESLKLQVTLEESQDALQLDVDCFAVGRPDLAADVNEFLHNEGLSDENVSSITMSIHESNLEFDTKVKGEYKDIDDTIGKLVGKAGETVVNSVDSIIEDINNLNDKLNNIEDTPEFIEHIRLLDSPDGISQEAWNRFPEEDRWVTRIKNEDRIFEWIETCLTDVTDKLQAAIEAMDDDGRDVDGNEHEDPYQEGYEAGYKDGLGSGQDQPGNGAATPIGAGLDAQSVYGDLLTGVDMADLEGEESPEGGESEAGTEAGESSGPGGATPGAGLAGGGGLMGMMLPLMMLPLTMMPMVMQAAQRREEDAREAEEQRKQEEEEAPPSTPAPNPGPVPNSGPVPNPSPPPGPAGGVPKGPPPAVPKAPGRHPGRDNAPEEVPDGADAPMDTESPGEPPTAENPAVGDAPPVAPPPQPV